MTWGCSCPECGRDDCRDFGHCGGPLKGSASSLGVGSFALKLLLGCVAAFALKLWMFG